MKILLTGSSGFLGQAILDSLNKPGTDVITLSRKNADILTDLVNTIPILTFVDTVIHAAGKAHVIPKTAQEKQDFFDVNVKGTQNLLTALERSGIPESFVFISSVAVYGLNKGAHISESAPLLGADPYGLSKIQAEHMIIEWCNANNVICTVLRLPLLVGRNPPGNLQAMINGIEKARYFNIAGGQAKKSMVLIEDVARIIPTAAKIGGVYNLTDGQHPSFFELSSLIAQQLNKSVPLNIPYFIAKVMALIGDVLGRNAPINSNKLCKITTDLTFDDTLARNNLDWKPTTVLKGFKV